MMMDEIPNVKDIEEIYNLQLVSDEFKNKADKYINNAYRPNGHFDPEDEEFYCI